MNPRNNRNNNQDFDDGPELKENIIAIDRVARVVKGGRRFRFRATAVVGNGDNQVGIGVAKGGDVQLAVQKAVASAKKNMVTIKLDNETIPHDTQAKVAGANILLMPAAEGTGLIAGGTVRMVLEVTGVKNILSKSIGSSNKINSAYATVKALQQLVEKTQWVNPPKTKQSSPVKEEGKKESATDKDTKSKRKSEESENKPASKSKDKNEEDKKSEDDK